MSQWNKADELDEDDIDRAVEEVDIFVKQDNFGSVYVTITFDQVKFLHDKIYGEQNDVCDCCAGTGKPVSGLPCICGWTGKGADEKAGLRKAVAELEFYKENKTGRECTLVTFLGDEIQRQDRQITQLQDQLKECKDTAFAMAVEKNHQLSKVTAERDRYREALEKAKQFIENGIEFGHITMPDKNTPDSAHETLPAIIQALKDKP